MAPDKNPPAGLRYNIDNLLFEEVDLSDAALAELDDDGQAELYLARAQLKLLISDLSMREDLALARKLMPRNAQYEPLYATMKLSSPNVLFRFPTTREGLQALWAALDQMQSGLAACTGPYGAYLCTQIRGEFLYFSGKYREALSLTHLLLSYFKDHGDTLRAMIAGYTFLRCQLALGDLKAVLDIVIELIHWSKASQDHQDIYRNIRVWLNVTTGWSGDSPRYHIVPDGTVIPGLQDRMAAVRQGVGRLDASEVPLGRLADKWGVSGLTMRDFFMRIYQTVAAYQTAAQPLSKTDAAGVLRIAWDTGLIQPIIEYGRQIVPMLEAARDEGLFEAWWLEEVIEMANEYEESICEFRDEA